MATLTSPMSFAPDVLADPMISSGHGGESVPPMDETFKLVSQNAGVAILATFTAIKYGPELAQMTINDLKQIWGLTRAIGEAIFDLRLSDGESDPIPGQFRNSWSHNIGLPVPSELPGWVPDNAVVTTAGGEIIQSGTSHAVATTAEIETVATTFSDLVNDKAASVADKLATVVPDESGFGSFKEGEPGFTG